MNPRQSPRVSSESHRVRPHWGATNLIVKDQLVLLCGKHRLAIVLAIRDHDTKAVLR